MTTRCNAGDLAIITHDFPSCAANIGRIVRLSGPAERDRNGRLTWLIEPITDEPYMVNDWDGHFVRFLKFNEQGIEHPDEWMTPVTANQDSAEVLADNPSSMIPP
jgi:hypothetical protein